MDAVRLPLRTDVVVSKLLAPSEGFGRNRISQSEARDSLPVLDDDNDDGDAPPSPPISGNLSATACEQISVSRNKNTVVELCMHESRLPSFGVEDSSKNVTCGEANNSFLLLPKCVGKQLHQKAGKVPKSGSTFSKRSKTDQIEDSMNLTEADDNNAISGKMGSNLAKCNSAVSGGKSRVPKQKHGQDGKRGDKKKFRFTTRTKFDSFISKAGLGSSNSVSGGNSILGVHGSKSDVDDIRKHVDELSLNELLDGSYRCHNLCKDRGKKSANANEHILHSVRKACSILPLRNTVESWVETDSSCKRETQTSLLRSNSCFTHSTDCDNRDKCMAGLASSSKDSCSKKHGDLPSMSDSTLYQPKDILECLALPPAKDLGSLLLHSPIPAVSIQVTPDLHTSTPVFHEASLPPFSWSISHGGPCKPNIESGRLSANKNSYQGRWVRIGNTSFLGNTRSCFSDLDFIAYNHPSVPSRQLNIDRLPENEKAMSMAVALPCCGQVGMSCAATCPPEFDVSDKTILLESCVMSSSLGPSFLERHMDSSDSRLNFGSEENNFHGTPDAQGSLKYRRNEANSLDFLPNNLLIQESKEIYSEIVQSKIRIHGCTDNYYSLSKSTIGGCDEHFQHIPTPEKSKQVGHSPRLLAAAQILWEISSYSNITGKKNQISRKIRWPKKPSQKAMKAPKLRPLMGNTERLTVTLKSIKKPGDLVKSIEQIPSSKPKFSMSSKKKNLTLT